MDIISALKESGLVGLGGASFPTWKKWEVVKSSDQLKRFLICNLSEGEPGVFKDEYILQNHLPEMISGIVLAAETIGAIRSYIFINDKYKKYIKKIKRLIGNRKIDIFIDTGRYLCGEETTLLQVIEGKLRQPRQKPPYPTDHGLYGYPTLIHNAETLYRAFLISRGDQEIKRFYSLTADGNRKIVEAKIDSPVSKIVPESVIKKASFFRLGGVTGSFYSGKKIDQIVAGTGAVEVFPNTVKVFDALSQSVQFIIDESCGKCTPCREGAYRIAEALSGLQSFENFWEHGEIIETIESITESAKFSSFCALGKSLPNFLESSLGILKEKDENFFS